MILYGDPESPGQPFVMRIRELPGTVVTPHSHPVDEHITVLQGTWYLGFGETCDMKLSGGNATDTKQVAPRGRSTS